MAVVDKYIIDVTTKGAKKSNTEMSKLSKTSKSLGTALGGAAAAYFGTTGLISAIQGSIHAFQIQEMAEKKLQTALGRTSQALLNQASALQKVTSFGDEAIIAQQAFLGSIGFTEEKIKELIPVALDLASATGQTLEFAVRNIAKTFSGLTGELGELIPQTKELTKEQLQAGGALKVISDLMGGSAEQNTKTMTGSLEQMTNAVGDTAESIGRFLSPSIIASSNVLTSMAKALTNAIDNFDRFMHGGSDVTGILTDLQYKSHLFNEELKDIADNEAALIEKGKELAAEFNELEKANTAVTPEMQQLLHQVQILEQALEKLKNKTDEGTSSLNDLSTESQGHIINLIQESNQIQENEKALKRYIELFPEQAKLLGLVKKETEGLNKTEKAYYASSLQGFRGMIKSKIQGYIAEAIASIVAKEITTKGLVGLITASAGAIAVGAIFDKLIPNFQTGGMVGGRRHSQGGTLIEAEQGEFVMNRNAVSAIGVENLNRMNQGQSSGGGSINININGGMISPDFVENELAESIREAVRRGADFGIS